MAYGGFKDLARRTASDRILRDKAFNIAKNAKYDGHQKVLASMVYKFFDKKSASLTRSETLATRDKSLSGNGIVNNNNNNNNSNNNNNNIYSNIFIVNINNNKYTKYAWVIPLKDKNGVSIVNAFQKILDKSAELCSMELQSKGPKLNKIWVEKGREFYNISFK